MREQLNSTKVSVVIPAFNCEEFIDEAIESVMAQTLEPFEVIVVDDGSTDGTLVTVERRWAGRVRLLSQCHSGPSAARNLGIRLAVGDLIAFLDADDRWCPEKLAIQVDYLQRHPDVGLVFSDMKEFGRKEGCRESFMVTKWIGRELKSGEVVSEAFRKLAYENFIPTPTVVVRAACLQETGLFDETLKSVEDRDLWLRLAAKTKLAFIQKTLVLRRLHEGNLSTNQWLAFSGFLQTIEKNSRINSQMLSPRQWRRLRYWARLECAYYLVRTDRCAEAQKMARKCLDVSIGLGALEVLILSRLGSPALHKLLAFRHAAGRLRRSASAR